MKHLRALFTAFGLLLLLGGAAPAQEPIRNKTPDDLDLLPRNAVFVVHFRIGDLWQRFAPLGVEARLGQLQDDRLANFAENMGFPLSHVDRLTVILAAGTSPDLLTVISTRQPVDRAKVRQLLLVPPSAFLGPATVLPGDGSTPEFKPPPPPKIHEKQVKGRTYHVVEREYAPRAVCFLSDRLFVFGDPAKVQAVLETADSPDTSPFAQECRTLAGRHAGLVAVNVENMPPQGRRQWESAPVLLPTVVHARYAAMTFQCDRGLEARLTLVCPDAAKAEIARTALTKDLNTLRGMLPAGVQTMAQDFVEDPDAQEFHFALWKSLDADLQKARVEVHGVRVQGVLRHACDDRFMGGVMYEYWCTFGLHGTRRYGRSFGGVSALLPMPGAPIPPGPPDLRIRPKSEAALKSIAAAFEKYRAKHGHYPPPAIYAKDGTPLLSWRVAILPYLGEEELYRKFKLDEPWNSKHNFELAKLMPKALGGDGPTPYPQSSKFRMLLGPGAAYEGKNSVKPGDLTDGAGQTLLVAETTRRNRSVDWTRPEGYRFASDLPLPRLTDHDDDQGFYALFADGTVRFIKKNVDAKTFRAMITKNGGEKLEAKDLGEVVK
jgi:hypothetical protein